MPEPVPEPVPGFFFLLLSFLAVIPLAAGCETEETAMRLELDFGPCLAPERVERAIVTIESEDGSLTRRVLDRSHYNIHDGFVVRLQPQSAAPAVSVSVSMLGRESIPLAETDPMPVAFQAGEVGVTTIDVECGPCTGNPACGGDPSVCGEPCDAVPEDCVSIGDDDADGLADCCDPDCSEMCAIAASGGVTDLPPLTPIGAELCSDGVDNDCDGLADCVDWKCFMECGGCSPFEASCFDGIDDDCDMFVDCQDPDCRGAPECAGTCEMMMGEVCDDWGYDNDCDGLSDCCDPDCAANPACAGGAQPETGMSCYDAIDNDCDGLLNCCDDQCFMEEGCLLRADEGGGGGMVCPVPVPMR